MLKPPCKKCGSPNLFLDVPRAKFYGDPYLGCVSCGWRLYGEEEIERYVTAYNKAPAKHPVPATVQQAAERLAEKEATRKKRDQELREKEAAIRAAQRRLRAVESHIPGYEEHRVGSLDPVLLVRWAAPSEEGDRPSCAWPPCENRAREKSKYCSRSCTVKVAHRRDKLRKAGKLSELREAS